MSLQAHTGTSVGNYALSFLIKQKRSDIRVLKVGLTLLGLGITVTLCACGGNVGSMSTSTQTKADATPPLPSEIEAPPAMIQVGVAAGVGGVLLDSAHKTVYRFSKDKPGSGVTHCYGSCARIWYPKPSGSTPDAGPGLRINQSKLGTIMRKDGTVQATYDGWPLYTNIRESSWEAKGAGKKQFGGTWYALRANGESVSR
jgi:predicted lipoprotein with Yx(FWY)xxD motif